MSDPRIISAIISALMGLVASLVTVYWLKPKIDKAFHLFQIRENYKHEQAKKIKEIIGKHKSHLLKSAELLHSRLKNYSRNHDQEWIKVNGDYNNCHHYIDTSVYRFLSFMAQIKLLEDNLEYLDTVNSDDSDMEMIRYFRIFYDLMTDVQLFYGFEYDPNYQTDHFFRNRLGQYVDLIIVNGKVMSFDEFEAAKNLDEIHIKPVFKFFDGISPNESRLRIERLKSLHCILMAFLNHFGYDFHTTEIKKVEELNSMLGSFKLKDNTLEIIRKYKLKESRWEAEKLINEYAK